MNDAAIPDLLEASKQALGIIASLPTNLARQCAAYLQRALKRAEGIVALDVEANR